MKGSNPGTLQGNVNFAAGMVGQAFSFNGVDSYVNVPDSDSLTIKTAITIEAWVKPSNPATGSYQTIASKTGRYALQILPDGRVQFYVEIIVSSDNQVNTVHPLQANVFTHVVGTYDPATGLQKIYLNGVLDNSRTTSGTPKGSGGPFQIGGQASAVIFYLFSGLIDEVRLFSRALSGPEILAIYSAGSAGMCKGSSGGGGGACGFTLLPDSQRLPQGGGTGTFDVLTGPGCNWGVVSNDNFITITSTSSESGNGTVSGSGKGKVHFAVSPYDGNYPRSGSLFLHGETFTVVQAGSCVYVPVVAPTYFDKAGGTGMLYVSTFSNCAWDAASVASSESWIHFASPGNGTGNGIASFTVDPNSGVYRIGQISPDFGLDLFSIVQEGYSCSYRLEAPPPQLYPQAGAQDSLNVVAPNTGACGWMAKSNDPWIELTAGQTGNGNGTVYFTLHPNSGVFRNGSIDVGGLTQKIQQDGCQLAVAPQREQILGQAGGTGSITVTTDSHCNWQASSTVDWITPASTGPQTGTQTLNFNVAENTSSSQRVGTIYVGDQSVSVRQENANGCYFRVTPGSNYVEVSSVDELPIFGAGQVYVDTPAGCHWTARSGAPDWIVFGDPVTEHFPQLQGIGPKRWSFGVIPSQIPGVWGGAVLASGSISVEDVQTSVFVGDQPVDKCPIESLSAGAPLKNSIISSARRLRNEVMGATSRGQLYTRLYYHFSPEVMKLALSNPKLLLHAAQLLNRYLPVMESLVNSKAASLSEADLTEVESLIEEFAVGASPEFLTTLHQLKKDLHDPWVHREFNLRVIPRGNPQ